MGDMTGLELFATKGIEYLLVIAYLALLVPAWLLLTRERRAARRVAVRAPRQSWFALPEGFYFHPGHAWAHPETQGIMRVGLDEFGGKLVGGVDVIDLPQVGTHLRLGDVGWRLRIGDTTLEVLSPVDGEVRGVNRDALADPGILHEDPYERGWLLEVAVAEEKPMLTSLLSGSLADAWMQDAVDTLRRRAPDEVGATLQDGGVPVVGLARAVDPQHWAQLAAELLRSAPLPRAAVR